VNSVSLYYEVLIGWQLKYWVLIGPIAKSTNEMSKAAPTLWDTLSHKQLLSR